MFRAGRYTGSKPLNQRRKVVESAACGSGRSPGRALSIKTMEADNMGNSLLFVKEI